MSGTYRHLENGSRGTAVAEFAGAAAAEAAEEIRSWPGYAPTPLFRLDGLARELGLAGIYAKHEGARAPLGSFKMLGAPHALIALAREVVPGARADALMSGLHAQQLRELTVVCASDGNHGRALAWAASNIGCNARIYLPASVSKGRADAIAKLGAEVVRVDDNYDAAVRFAALEAEEHGWHVISDTAYPGYDRVPRQIMEGYTLVAEEIVEQIGSGPVPTHVILQVGCGGMAASIASRLRIAWPDQRPALVTVEPLTAACLLETAAADQPVRVEGDHETIMGGLACGEVSEVAWTYLRPTVAHYLAMGDDVALAAMRELALGTNGDPPLVSGETGAAGIGALILAHNNASLAKGLGLDSNAFALVIITEGATDAAEYERLVGLSPASVTPAQAAAA
jgi:diaminopropionate ammonia-lyase